MRKMTLTIMYKDKSVEEIQNIYKVSNLSTKFKNDCLYYETILDKAHEGTCVEYNKILCFEVKDER